MKLKNSFEVLDKNELLKVHEASLEVLSKTGMVIRSQRALRILDEAGAEVDFQKKLVKFPKRLIEESLESVPEKISVYDTRSKKIAFVLGDGETRTVAGCDAAAFVDLESGKRRQIRKSDVVEFTRVADALENISMVGCAGYPQDVVLKATALHAMDAVVGHTSKPLYFPHEGLSVTKAAFEIARVVSGEEDLSNRPILICQVSPSSPLMWVEGTVESLLEIANSRVPCTVLPGPLSGVTAPFTLAGHLVLHNAEFLSGAVISQIVRRGAPILYGQVAATFDMRYSNASFGAPEPALVQIAGVQMAKFYRIPSFATGPDTDALCIDAQNGWEKGITGILIVCTGIELIADFGLLDADLAVSIEQLIVDSEIFDMISRLKKGMDVSAETMATGVIDKVGPRGSYLCEEHTLRHLRNGEYWPPSVSTRSNYEAWIKAGSTSVVEKARERAKEILTIHPSLPLGEKKQKEIDRIIERFETEVG